MSQFIVPSKSIYEESDLEEFKRSKSYQDIISFIKICSESVVGLKFTTELESSSIYIEKFVHFISQLATMIDEIPPIQQPMRYGNKAFRDWHLKLISKTNEFLSDLLPINLKNAAIELAPYINQAFGNETRIDYGTGHELSIIMFFFCLFKLEIISKKDLSAVVLRGFYHYIKLMRKLQMTYMLEPAGSHGVWGLDDYHCLTFVFGSAQLIGHPEVFPNSINNEEILKEFSSEYLYLEGISFIKKIKSRAPFHETSPMLYDISNLPDWSKVHAGLLRLFQGEVLNKLPVVQHIPFGSLLRCTWSPHIPAGSADRNPTGTTLLTEDQIRQIQMRTNTQTSTPVTLSSTSTTSTANMSLNTSASRSASSQPVSPPASFEAQTRAPWARNQ